MGLNVEGKCEGSAVAYVSARFKFLISALDGVSALFVLLTTRPGKLVAALGESAPRYARSIARKNGRRNALYLVGYQCFVKIKRKTKEK